MKIESLKLVIEQTSLVGLKEINLPKLGQVVLIAGRNGSGKTRLLNLIPKEIARLRGISNAVGTHKERITSFNNSVEGFKSELLTLRSHVLPQVSTLSQINLKRQIEQLEINIKTYTEAVNREENLIRSLGNIKISGEGAIYHYVPKQLTLKDPNILTKKELLESAEAVQYKGLRNLPLGTLSTIQIVQERYHNSTHQFSSIKEKERTEAVLNYNRLKSSIKEFIGVELDRDTDGNATLFGKPIGQSSLSDGQVILLQLCVALYAQELSLPDLVLLLDEPENHLHPAALNYVLDRLQAVVTRGQIWIATHSINVLAHFDNPTVYYMEDGELSYAGDVPERVLAGLLGSEEEREKLGSFLSLPFEMSSIRFAYESLLLPTVIMTNGKDPQLQQIQRALFKVQAEQGKVRVLDFGAGRGRLIATIEDIESTGAEEQPAVWLDYVAYDPYPANAAECQANIERVYGYATGRYFSDLGVLRTHCHDGSFDMVLLTRRCSQLR